MCEATLEPDVFHRLLDGLPAKDGGAREVLCLIYDRFSFGYGLFKSFFSGFFLLFCPLV